ncbi:cytochrome P450 [Rostrohypoxylon terebratum]|nr:cytochrome P450 [Rostrohypoxylon terebratum]
MFANIDLSNVALVVGVVLAWYLVLLRGDPKKDELWNKLDKVGVPSGFLPWTRAVLVSWTTLLENTHEGYNQFCKKGLPFALPSIWTGKAVVVIPPSALHLTNRPDNELLGYWALIESIQLSYFIPDRNVFQNVIHFEVSRKDFTKRNVNRQLAPTVEELENSFHDLWGNSTEWTTANGWDMCGQIIARVALRTLLGFPTCRDKELIEATRHFANNLFAAAAIINCVPPSLRPILGPILAFPTKRYRDRYRKIVVPVIEERIRLWEKHEKMGEGELPSDFLQWLVARAAQHGPEHMNPSTISYRLLSLNTMFIYAMSYMFAHTIINICASPDHKRFMEGLEAECKAVAHRYPDGLASDEAIEQLHRVDSAIRESMRFSDANVLSLPRDIVGSKPLDLGNGIICPPGTRLMYPSQPVHIDPDFWDDPLRYDAFRFSDPFDEEAGGSPLVDGNGVPKKRESLVDLTPSFLAWGYGKRACPGRWYAGQVIKQSLAYMVMNYEVELVGELPKRKALLNAMVPPTGARLRFRRRI